MYLLARTICPWPITGSFRRAKRGCFCGCHCQPPAHRLNLGQREETPVWPRAESLNKQHGRGQAKVEPVWLRIQNSQNCGVQSTPTAPPAPGKTQRPHVGSGQTKESGATAEGSARGAAAAPVKAQTGAKGDGFNQRNANAVAFLPLHFADSPLLAQLVQIYFPPEVDLAGSE